MNALLSTLACPPSDPIAAARKVAPTNVRLAYWLAQARPMLGIYSLSGTFSNGAEGSFIDIGMPSLLGEDFYLTDLRSAVERPNAFAGNIFKGQADDFNARNPNIHATFSLVGGRPGAQYLVNQDFAPLQLLAPPVGAPALSPLCQQDFVFEVNQGLKARLILRRTYAQSELPVNVSVTMTGWSLGCRQFNGISESYAREQLLGRELGHLGIIEDIAPRVGATHTPLSGQ